ncbi:MAG: efflux RND transporter periplasmic adaptor subunit [Zavarzinella sp.]
MNDQSNHDSNGNGSHATLVNRLKELNLTDRVDKTGTSRGTAWLPWLLCIMLGIGWSTFAIKSFRPPDDGKKPLAKMKGGPPSAQGTTPTTEPKKADELLLEVKGYLIPTKQISVSPIDVAGRVKELFIEEGKRFSKNAILATIESTPYQAQHAEAVANVAAAEARYQELVSGSRPEELDQAKAELEDAMATLDQFKLEWDRLKKQNSGGFISQREYEQAEANYLTSIKRVDARQKAFKLLELGPRQERLDAAKAELDSAKARLAQSQWRIDNCTIRSPVAGIILTKSAEVGSLVNPVVGGVSTSLCNIADLRKIEVDLEVQERNISSIEDDLACKIRADAWPDRVYEGYVERIMPIANRAKSVVPVRVKVVIPPTEIQGSYLKPEMSVTVQFYNRKVTEEYKKKVLADEELDIIPDISQETPPKTKPEPKKNFPKGS